VFRHSVLVFDAITSVLAQIDSESVDIIIVDDGCPHEQTVAAGFGLANAYQNVYYIRQANRGLSGARNCGIDFVRANIPECEAIYFLDADNVLLSFALQSMRKALDEFPDDDWFYPDITYFGLKFNGDYAGAYSPVTQAIRNICEAGSLVRMRVFDAGTRFDEKMQLGYEDWDFWLSAVEHGFRGRHLPSIGFRYRKRLESMITDSHTNDAEIRRYMERKHPWMNDPIAMVGFEHRDAPRYAIWLVDQNVVHLTSDPFLDGETLSLAEYQQRFLASVLRPNVYAAGAIFVATTEPLLRHVRKYGLLRWVFWDSEVQLLSRNIISLNVDTHQGRSLKIELGEMTAGGPVMFLGMTIRLLRDICLDSSDRWINAVPEAPKEHGIALRRITVPEDEFYRSESTRILSEMVNLCHRIRSETFYRSRNAYLGDRELGTPDLSLVPEFVRQACGKAVVAPFAGERCRRVAFVLTIFNFGGVEKSALCVARTLKKYGYSPCLVMLSDSEIHLNADVEVVFDEIYMVDRKEFEDWSGPEYYGTSVSQWALRGDTAELTNLLSTFDVVINCHASDVLGTMKALRKRGIVTVSYLHLFDRTEFGREIGHATLAIGYEHVHDFFIGCSHMICAQLRALGVPAEKVLAVPNAPTCSVSVPQTEAIMQARSSRIGRPLRVLYLGRLDYQKGLDRLSEVVDRMKAVPDVVTFRVVGKAIIDGKAFPREIQDITEPAVHGDAALAELYAWADVVLLPSRFEGLPLTILEAMQFGAVPIAADAGAVSEIIEHDVNGLIVPQDDVVEQTVAALCRLADDREHLMMLAVNGRKFVSQQTWDAAVQAFLVALTALRQKRAAAASAKRSVLKSAVPSGSRSGADTKAPSHTTG